MTTILTVNVSVIFWKLATFINNHDVIMHVILYIKNWYDFVL